MASIQSNGSGRTKATNGQKDDWFNTINPDKMINNAQRILSSAVNVLEEEIAAGILAAKKNREESNRCRGCAQQSGRINESYSQGHARSD